MPKVFISHAWEDNEVSRKLAGCLRRDGAQIWIYYTQVEVDGRLPEVFERAIEWCDTFVLVWSQSAATSYCVSLEWQMALNLKKTIIPCLLDDTKQYDVFRNLLHINFNSFDQGYDNLIHALNLNTKENKTLSIDVEKAEDQIPTALRFRRDPKILSVDEAEIMIKNYDFFDNKRNEKGRGIEKKYDLQNVNGNSVIFDHASGLMWQQNGSSELMWYDKAKKWVEQLNQEGYAGYRDWHLPTLEEAMSLMKWERSNDNLYIDPLFDKSQYCIWTSDLAEKESQAWVVFFNYGYCHVNYFDFNNFIRVVRYFE